MVEDAIKAAVNDYKAKTASMVAAAGETAH